MENKIRAVALLPLLAMVLGIACGSRLPNTGTAGQPTTPSDNPAQNAQCQTVQQPTYSQEFLVAADINHAPLVWMYQIDPRTGVPTLLPWSPFATVSNPHCFASDINGNYLYIAADNPFSPTGIDRVLETYRFAGTFAAPSRVNYQNSGYGEQIEFDPQQHFLYLFDPLGYDGQETLLQRYATDPFTGIPAITGTPTVITPQDGTNFSFKAGGSYIVVSRASGGNIIDASIQVYQRNCATGATTKVSELSYRQGLIFATAARIGPVVVGYRCLEPAGTPVGAQPFLFDASTGTVTAVKNGFVPGICKAVVDQQGQYLIASLREDPTSTISSDDIVGVFKINSDGTLTQTDRYAFPRQTNPPGVPQLIGSLAFDPTANFFYLGIQEHLAAFRIDRTTGKITQLPGSPYPAPTMFRPLYTFGKP